MFLISTPFINKVYNMEFSVTSLVYDICIISFLLFISKIIRTRIVFIQKLYIPVSLIAGFLGLFLGKYFLNILPFSNQIDKYSGVLIAIVFGSMFIGNKRKVRFKDMISSVADTFLVNTSFEVAQFAIFTLIGLTILPLIFPNISKAFGLMLPSGFVGGHGTAAAIGNVLESNGWVDAVSVGQTFATIGILSGLIGGVFLINTGVKKGYTALIKDVKTLPKEMLTGLVDKDNRISFGENTINSSSIDTLTWHLSLVLSSVGLAYLINRLLNLLFPNVSFPIYGLALISSILVSKILNIFKLDAYVDKQIITHIGSSATDYLIAFGVASVNITIFKEYFGAIVILSILGLLFTISWFLIISPRFFKSYWFERGIYIYGLGTGVMATGIILLRICDPNFKTGVLEDFGLAWVFLSFIDLAIVSFLPICILSGIGIQICIILIIIAISCLLLCKK